MVDPVLNTFLWVLIKALCLSILAGGAGFILGYYFGRHNRQTKTYEFQIEQED